MKDDESLADEPVRNSNLNLVILGKDGLATTLNHYIRVCFCLLLVSFNNNLSKKERSVENFTSK